MAKIILVRINLDIEEKDFKKALRFQVAVSLIKSLSKENNKVVILSHKGRPRGYDKKLSMKPFVKPLSKEIGKRIIFIEDLKGAKKEIKSAPSGTVLLLENLRFLSGEKQNSLLLAKKLASLGDEYINNDFAASHRKAASLVAITKFLPSKKGEIIQSEIKALTRIIKAPKHPFVLIIGGAKIKTKASTIKSLLPHVDYVLLGGGVGNTFLKAKGVDIGKSLHEPKMVKKIRRLAKNKKIITPMDHIIERGAILDIGPKTRKEYSRIISEAKTIIWAGPMGKFEIKKFSGGTRAIANTVLKNKKARTVIGGVETVYSLPIKTDSQNMGNLFLSTGGGAMLHFLVGKKLPALAALKKGKPRRRREAIKTKATKGSSSVTFKKVIRKSKK